MCLMILLQDVVNVNTWGMFSNAARTRLAALLPPTSFVTSQPETDTSHPSRATPVVGNPDIKMDVDEYARSDAYLKDEFMNCPSLQTAIGQFQASRAQSSG